MKYLAIETSFDDTSLAIINVRSGAALIDQGAAAHPGAAPKTIDVLFHQSVTKSDWYQEFGGVVPNLAKKQHAALLPEFIEEGLREAGLYKEKEMPETLPQKVYEKIQSTLEREPESLDRIVALIEKIEKPTIDVLCVTMGPGLEPALWVGINVAKALSIAWELPLIPVNHMEGHFVSVQAASTGTFTLEAPQFPLLALLVSGGHTELVLSESWGTYKKIGQTRDDAAGEAYDKIGRLMGLGFPAGREMGMLAGQYRDFLEKENIPAELSFTPPMLHSRDYDFSFSGLKTAARNYIQQKKDLSGQDRQMIAYAFNEAVVSVLVKKSCRAADDFSIQSFAMAGGVAANPHLRRDMITGLAKTNPAITFLLPGKGLSTDNALMIAVAGLLTHQRLGKENIPPLEKITARGNWSIAEGLWF